jgi:hypothetical protein
VVFKNIKRLGLVLAVQNPNAQMSIAQMMSGIEEVQVDTQALQHIEGIAEVMGLVIKT